MAELGQDTFAEFIGATVVRLEPGLAQARLVIGEHHLNPHGTAHGAVLYSLAGVAIAASINDDVTSGIVWSASIDYVSPARLGDELVARTELEPQGDREVLVSVIVSRPLDGEVVATATASAKVRPRQTSQ